MPYFPRIPEGGVRREVVDVFGGYDHNLKISDGELYDMQNLTGDFYPLLSSRRKRATAAQLEAPVALLAKAALAYIDGTKLFYDGADVTSHLTAAGLGISADAAMLPKTMVSMGAYILIFPDRLYINTEALDDCGSIDARFTASSAVSYTLCKSDGSAYQTPTVAAVEPTSPDNGALWIDSSGSSHALKQYNSATGTWTAIESVYVKLACTGIGADFARYDGVTVSGCTAPGEGTLTSQAAELNGTHIIYDRGEDYIVVAGLLDESFSQSDNALTVSRKMPDMDFVTEAGNRLWGCKYGVVDGETVNEIYGCALGDFRNWRQFMGLSTDSYAASVGTDGAWTGAVTHLGNPLFFKENCLHKVFVSSSGAHRISDTACRGVQTGSAKSLCVVNETLYYKSGADVCAYDGSLPVNVSAALGAEKYFDAAAGSIGDNYYISMRDGSGAWHMFVLNTARGFWHREDAAHALCFARCAGELYYIDADSKKMVAALGGSGTPEDNVEWSATSGLLGCESVEQKYVSRLNLRMKLPKGSEADMYIQYDSDGVWRHAGHMDGTGTRSFVLPLRPRRCDHFRFKLCGKGEMKIYSLAKDVETGSDE